MSNTAIWLCVGSVLVLAIGGGTAAAIIHNRPDPRAECIAQLAPSMARLTYDWQRQTVEACDTVITLAHPIR